MTPISINVFEFYSLVLLCSACTIIFFAIDIEQFAPVENITVTDVGPTSFTVQWNVSINLRRLGRFNSHSRFSSFSAVQLLQWIVSKRLSDTIH